MSDFLEQVVSFMNLEFKSYYFDFKAFYISKPIDMNLPTILDIPIGLLWFKSVHKNNKIWPSGMVLMLLLSGLFVIKNIFSAKNLVRASHCNTHSWTQKIFQEDFRFLKRIFRFWSIGKFLCTSRSGHDTSPFHNF